MMKFNQILRTLFTTYNIDKEHFAEHLHTDAATVDKWLKGKELPSHHQLEHISDMYILPMKVLEESCKEDM